MKLPIFPYGGDYNPEQWPREVWDEDVRLMPEANWNIATLPVFGWVSLEPEEGRYTFEWLDEILDKLYAKGVRACLATATATVPAWLPAKYPDVLVVNEEGVRVKHGNRHTFCPSSPNFRRLSTTLARKIAERYKDHPALLLWHVSNEYCTYCYCDLCAQAFREWLQARYGSLDELNERWYTRFWGKTYTDWSQIQTPTRFSEHALQALKLDYWRFQSDSILESFKAEAAVLREVTPGVPITTNLMGPFPLLDYHRWAREMDVVSWDNYPRPEADPADVAFSHALMRGLKEGQPFLLLEQSPSQQNWAPYNRLKPPGQLRLQSWQAVAQGSNSVMYFQWRRGRGGIEKLHGAVMEHGGTSQNRVFREVSDLGAELRRVMEPLVCEPPPRQGRMVRADLMRRGLGVESSASSGEGRMVRADLMRRGLGEKRACVLFDWPTMWALKLSSGPSKDLDYTSVVRSFYRALHRLGIPTDVLSPEADFSNHDLIVAPLLTMLRQPDAERVRARVAAGAALLTTTFSGFVDDTDRVFLEGAPGPWRDLLGLSVEETDALLPTSVQNLRMDGLDYASRLLCDRIRVEGAETIGTYTHEFYAGEPAFTRHRFGEGRGYYLATLLEDEGLEATLGLVCREMGLNSPLAGGSRPPRGVEVSMRGDVLFLLNHGLETVKVPLDGGHFELIEEREVAGEIELHERGVAVLAPLES